MSWYSERLKRKVLKDLYEAYPEPITRFRSDLDGRMAWYLADSGRAEIEGASISGQFRVRATALGVDEYLKGLPTISDQASESK